MARSRRPPPPPRPPPPLPAPPRVYHLAAGSANFRLRGAAVGFSVTRRTDEPLPEAPVMLGAIVDPGALLREEVLQLGERGQDGQLVLGLFPAWEAIVAMLAKDPLALYHIAGRKLEELVAASYEAAGYDEVTLTPRSRDHGRDVIAVKRGWLTVRIVDQAKAYKPGSRIPADDVRAMLGVVLGDPRASKGVITTTADFAPEIAKDPIIAPHMPFRLELVNGERLRSIWASLPRSSVPSGPGKR